MTARARRPRRSGWKWAILVLVLAAGCFFSLGIFQRVRENRYPPNAFHQVKRGDMLVSLTEDGALRALNETVIRSALEGLNRILYLVPEGSYVQKGDLLVELDSSGLRDRFNEQELQYQELLFQVLQAGGNLKIQRSLAESQIKDAELKVENAQADLEKYRDGDAPLLIKTIEARAGVLAEQVRIASERYERTQELFKKNNASRSELEADALTLTREKLALSQYEEDLRLVKKYDQPNQVRLLQSNVEQAQAELSRLKQRTSNEIAQAEADLKTGEAALEFLQEGLKTQQRRLESSRIYAPQNGLVVYAAVSPFQFSRDDDERRRDEGRFRRGRGGDSFSGEFRFGGRRGGRSGFESSSGGSSGSGGSGSSGGASSSSVAETIAGGNQRIASAISGTPATESGSTSSGGGGGGSGGAGGSSGGGRSGGSSGGSSGGGQNAMNPATAFASYPSMRPSSLFGSSSASNSSGGGSASSASPSGQGSSEGNRYAGGNQSSGNQSGFRSSQSYRDFGFDYYGTPGLLEEGTMVRQRQELIRLPDISKMLAEIKIPEARVRQVKAGMTAYVSINNIPHHRFKGTVRRVALLPDSQSSWMNPDVKLYPADILVEEELPILKPGVSATAEVIITNLTNVLSVPIQAVALLAGENVCFIKDGSGVKPVPVTTGWFNDSFVEITWGLKEGDLVLLAPESDEDIVESLPEDTNNVPAGNELEPLQRPDQPRSGQFPDPTPSPRNGEPYEPGRPTDSFRRGQPSESSFREGDSGEPGTRRRGMRDPSRFDDSSRMGDPSRTDERSRMDGPPRSADSSRTGDPSRRGESYDPSQPGQNPENRRFRRRDFESTNGAAPPTERRRGPGRERPAEEAPE